MHELAIASRLLDIIESEMDRHSLTRVDRVTVRIGVLSGVERAALDFSWHAAIKGTRLQQTALEIESVPIRCRCNHCDHTFELEEIVFCCPACASRRVEMLTGQEIEISALHITDSELE